MSIVPDTKDWTWVLERACPECGFEATTVQRGRIAEQLVAVTRQWEEALGAPGATRRSDEHRWSTLEYGCHVRDVFRLFRTRLDSMLVEADPMFANWDQDATAVEDRYWEQDPTTVAGQLAQAGMTMAAVVERLSGEDWQRPGRRSDGARFTVDSFCRYLLHDPTHHLWDVGAAPP